MSHFQSPKSRVPAVINGGKLFSALPNLLTQTTTMLYLLATLVALLLAVILIFNALVRKRNAADFAFSCIDAQLAKRFDLIPNLVAIVKGYAAHEATVLREVTELRAQIAATAPDTRRRFDAEAQLAEKLPALIAIAENYPALKADAQFLHLQHALAEIEEQISAARRAFNAAIYEYNNAVQTVPSSLIAGLCGYRIRAYFHITDAERANPGVAAA